jgi:hypothetical protein
MGRIEQMEADFRLLPAEIRQIRPIRVLSLLNQDCSLRDDQVGGMG